MRSLFRIFSFGLVCSLLIASSDAAVNGSIGDDEFGASFGASMASLQAPGAWATLRQHIPTASGTEALNGSIASGVKLTSPHNEIYGNAASGGPRKEYGRSGRSLAAAQSSSVVTVSPGAYQTPDPGQGGSAVSGPANTGHGNTSVNVAGSTSSDLRTCEWHAFPNVNGTITSITLKFDWITAGDAYVRTYQPEDSGEAYAQFNVEYSLNGGSSWTNAVGGLADAYASGEGGYDSRNFASPGWTTSTTPFSVSIPPSTPISQIRVRDRLFASLIFSGFPDGYARVDAINATRVENIRLEVETWNCIATVPGDRWKGEYFNNTNLSGSPTMVRDDGADFLNFNWGSGSPHSICAPAVDNFSARWTRTVNFAADVYRFTAAVDNGVRLYVDGQLKIDQWANLPPNTYTADVMLSAGNHEIKLEFVEYTGAASASLSWVALNFLANVPANRWKGEYYNNITLSGPPLMVRDEGASFLNFNFGLGGPGGNCGLGVDNFSARWTRTVNFGPGIYRFSVTGDDGVRLYVDGQLKIDKWFLQGATTYTADVALTVGNHVVKLEYFEGGGPGVALLSWTAVAGLSCLPDVLIGAAPRTGGGGESIATTTISGTPKRCGQKNSE